MLQLFCIYYPHKLKNKKKKKIFLVFIQNLPNAKEMLIFSTFLGIIPAIFYQDRFKTLKGQILLEFFVVERFSIDLRIIKISLIILHYSYKIKKYGKTSISFYMKLVDGINFYNLNI